MTQKNIEDFWENACDVFGFDVSSKTHPMHKAYLTYLEMTKEESEWCECNNCGIEITNEKSEIINDECICLECFKKYVEQIK